MEWAAVILQVVIALGIFNVWILRHGKATSWRGGDATNLKEEFEAYGLPGWFMALVGMLKILCASLLIAGIWLPVVVKPAAIGLALLMLGAVVMHIRVKDPLRRSLPALCMLVLSVIVAVI